MNKDLDERLVPNGQYRDAMNIQIRTTDGDAAGTVQNIQGNTPFMYANSSTFTTNKSKVIGSIADEKNNKAYFLVAAPEFNIPNTAVNSQTLWIDSIVEVDDLGFNKVVVRDLFAVNVTQALASLTATADTNSITISSSYNTIFQPNMRIQLYASNGTALLTSNTKILTVSGTTITVDKKIPTAINSGTCSLVKAWKPKTLGFSQEHRITGLNIIDDFLFFTDGRTEPKKVNIRRSIDGTEQAAGDFTSTSSTNTKLHLDHQAGGGSKPITDFESDHEGSLLEEHITVVRKAPRSAPNIDMSSSSRTGTTTFNIPVKDFSTINVNDYTNVVTDTQGIAIFTGDILNLECLNDTDGSPSIVRVKVIQTSVPGTGAYSLLPSNANIHTVQVLSIPSSIASTHTQWVATLDKPKPIFELKFPRFGYRYKYNDGEYSSFSPFSEIAFLPGEFDYESKKGFNLGMVNNLRELKVTNFLPDKSIRPDDIEAVDILYKSTDSPNIYVVKTINRDFDPEWQTITSVGNGEVKITSDMIYKVLPSDQILRSWDNVPRFAKAQEIVGNRLVYGNYTQGYDTNFSPGLDLSMESNSITTFLTPEKSIKSLRSYKFGAVYGDKYGRETPVISTGNRSYVTSDNSILEFSDSMIVPKSDAVKVNNFSIQQRWEIGNVSKATFPNWVDYVKYYVKETSSEYYNLLMDRWYDASDGNVWISFASADRNKVDEETYLILKTENGSNNFVDEEARYKVIAISNEAPDFIKIDQRRIGDLIVDGDDSEYIAASGYEVNIVAKREFIIDDNTFFQNFEFKGTPVVRIRAESRSSVDVVLNRAYTSYQKVTKVSPSTTQDSVGTFNIQFSFGDEAKFVNYFIDTLDYADVNAATNETTGIRYFFEFKDNVVENKPEFDGRFFVKVERDNILDEKILGLGNASILYAPTESFKIGYIDTNTYNHPSNSDSNLYGTGISNEFNSGNYNWNGFNVSDLGANVASRFATTTYKNATREYWEKYRLEASTPIFIDAADAAAVFEFTPSFTTTNPQNLALQLFTAEEYTAISNDEFPVDGLKRGFARSGSASEGTFDRLYFGKHLCKATNTLNIDFNENPSIGGGTAAAVDDFGTSQENFRNLMSTPGTYFRFKNDINPSSVYIVVPNGQGDADMVKNYHNADNSITLDPDLNTSGGINVFNTSQHRAMFYTTFRKVNLNGQQTNDGIDFVDWDPRGSIKHDGESFVDIEILQRIDTFNQNNSISTKSAIWETEPKESIDLDVYYEASNAIPVVLRSLAHTVEFAPTNSTIKVFTEGVEQTVTNSPFTVSKVYNGALQIKDSTGTLVTSGIDLEDELEFTHANGVKTRAKVESFLTTDIESNGMVETSVTATGYYKLHIYVHNNRVTLPWSNCFTFGNGVESNRIRDDFNATFIDNGVNASSVLTEYGREDITNGLIYSGIYNSNSNVNNLNEFNVANRITKEINPSYGSIQALKTRDTDLITFTEDKVLRILANKDALFNADGNTNVTSSDNVLGQAVPYVGDYGISKNPESLATDQFRMYFTDKQRGAVLRLSRDGLTPISNVGMKTYFRNNLKKTIDLVGSFDTVAGEYNVAINYKPEFRETNTTASFNEAGKGWVSFKSFVPDSGVSMSGEYYTSNEHIIYKHHVDVDHSGDTVGRNKFYGASIVNSYIDFIFNDIPGSVKNFKTISYEGSQGYKLSINNKEATDAAGNAATYNDDSFAAVTSSYDADAEIKGWKITSVSTDLQEGKVIDFSGKEGKWYGNIVGDFDVSNTSPHTFTVKADPSEISTQGLGVPNSIVYSDGLAGTHNLIIEGGG
jgi:hypothetical protein